MADRVIRLVLAFQGLYYGLTGLWAIVSLESFSHATDHAGEPFEMHSIAALAVVLGAFFLWGARDEAVTPAVSSPAAASWIEQGPTITLTSTFGPPNTPSSLCGYLNPPSEVCSYRS